MIPYLADGTVTAQDGDGYKVYVVLEGGMGGQGPTVPVQVLLQGHCDGVRGDWPPLPAVGTKGRVSFTRSDHRNGVWLGAYPPAFVDSAAHTAAQPNLRYRADFDGAWYWHGEDGTTAWSYPDGTSILLGSAMPAPTRHTLTSGQARQAVPFSASQRNPSPPGPMPLTLVKQTAGGVVQISVSAAGAVTVSGVSGAPVSLFGGGCAVVLSGGVVSISGAVEVTGDVVAAAGGSFVSLLMHLTSDAGGTGTSGPPVPGT